MKPMRTIRVTGTGTLRLHPDVTRLTMTLQGTDPDYGAALRRASEETETLRGVLAGLGFARDALKTLQFSVDTLYEGYQDERGVYRNRFVGYQFRHELKLEFPSDNELLGKTLYALSHCAVTPEFRISYTLADPEAAKRALLLEAVRDARGKAEALSAAAGVRLGALRRIEYAQGAPEMEVRPMHKLMAERAMSDGAAGSYDMNIEPDDLAVTDSVTVIWELGE